MANTYRAPLWRHPEGKLLFWKVSKRAKVLRKHVLDNVAGQLKQRRIAKPKFWNIKRGPDLDAKDTWIVFGPSLSEIAGFLKIVDCGSGPVGKISSLMGLDGDNGAALQDEIGQVVDRRNLHHYVGYNEFSDGHTLCSLREIEVFRPSLGMGSLVLDVLKSQFDFIELEAAGQQEERFFLRNDFAYTAFKTVFGDESDMANMIWY